MCVELSGWSQKLCDEVTEKGFKANETALALILERGNDTNSVNNSFSVLYQEIRLRLEEGLRKYLQIYQFFIMRWYDLKFFFSRQHQAFLFIMQQHVLPL